MAEPFDTIGASFADVIDRLAKSEITEAQAAAALSPLLASTNDGEFGARVAEIIGVVGRITGLLMVEAPPSNLLGAPGSYAWDRVNKVFYGPKDAVTGWPAGDAMTEGPPGPSVELQKTATHVQWRVQGGAWANLILLSDLKGADGSDGADGTDGTDGANGQEVGLQTTATHVQWRLGAGAWTDLISLALLKGADGVDGTDGIDGREVQLQTTPTYIQWRYAGEAAWGDLIALALLKGDKGDRGDAFTVNAQGNLAGRAAYDAEAVGFSYLDVENGNLYFRIAAGGWSTPIPFGKGDKGDDGDPGSDGASAYAVAVTNGFVGTEAAWLASLVGAKGDDGDQGPPGADGADGADGSDATVTGEAIEAALGFTPADPSTVPVKATGSELRTGTNDAKFLTAKSVTDAAAIAALTLATPDLSIPNQTITLSANSTLGAPTGAVEGKSGTILIKQDATGSRTLAYNAAWKPFGSVPALSTAANSVDLLTWFAEGSSKVRFTLQKGGAA